MKDSHMKRIETLPFIDFFAACGGISLGMEQANFTLAFANGIWGVAVDEVVFNAETRKS